jgi:hypothetical protein
MFMANGFTTSWYGMRPGRVRPIGGIIGASPWANGLGGGALENG